MLKSLNVQILGECKYKSPFELSKIQNDGVYDYVKNDERILLDNSLQSFLMHKTKQELPLSFEKAGPRENLFFDSSNITAAIVTCGGLCPGMNDVIRSLVMELHYRYGVKKVLGVRYGYRGFIKKYKYPMMLLTPEIVTDIHLLGGTILGSSRGDQNVSEIVDSLVENGINLLFTIGGDGTLRGSHAIHEEIQRRKLNISIAGIPKTIDNDISYIERSFGFETAFSIATDIIKNAHNEAKGVPNGVALIKLMGRDSGFIAAYATKAMPEVNFVLIPEMDFDLHGEKGFLQALKMRLHQRNHALIVVAEGAGQKFFEQAAVKKDVSGNVIHNDIGIFLKDEISEFLSRENIDFSMKYIDPSYIIRSAPANANDRMFCGWLAQNAVHGAMSGKTDFITGTWHNQFIYLPISVAIEKRKKIDIESVEWWSVLEATGQPNKMLN